MRRIIIALAFVSAVAPFVTGCGGGSETSEVEVTAYDPSVEARLEERAGEQMSEAERRKSAQ